MFKIILAFVVTSLLSFSSYAQICTQNLTYEQNIAQAKNNALIVRADTGRGLEHGSAVVWNEHFIITNYHVVKNAQQIVVRDAWNGSHYTHVIATSPDDDLAILANTTRLRNHMWGSGRDPQPQELLLAIGNPHGRGFASSTGYVMVTNINQQTPTSFLTNLIVAQIDLLPGMSGGPVYDRKGCFVGISTAKSQNVGFIIPAKTIINMLRRLGY